MPTPIDLENRIIKRYAGNGISISNDRVISVLLRAANNLAKFTDDEH
ncbi:MAG: hypothetical protein LBG59_08040 [Candidatus Peribacteria bacterium]|jgi:hypothetical protein|nr:hypothetical protein [Candidatus Peribacteria bacterium]